MNRWNIVYLHTHDTGRYIQPYGYAVPTPHLQQLAEQGVLMRDAHCANPTCSPSRACLLTGQHAHQNGMLGLSHRGFALSDPRKHLAHTLRGAGYHTVLAGVQHVTAVKDEPSALSLGYERWLNPSSMQASSVVDAAVTFLSEKHDRPFFLDVGTKETHRPFPSVPAGSEARYLRAPALLPDTPDVRQDWAEYCASAAEFDAAVGRLLATLRQTGQDRNTLIICTTDHGVAFPHMKCNLTHHGTGVMLILQGPEGSRWSGGRVIDPLVSHLDLFPTICDELGITPPGWLVGRSLVPLVDGKQASLHDQLVTTVNTHTAAEPMRCVRTQRYSYIRRFKPLPERVLPNVDAGLSKSHLLAHGWAQMPEPEEALYDLVMDPMERASVAEVSSYRDILVDMRRRLINWQRETGDPLLAGDLPLPAGARLEPPIGAGHE